MGQQLSLYDYDYEHIFHTGGETDKIFWRASRLGEDTREDDGGFKKKKGKTPINTQVGRQNTGVKKKIAEWAKAAALKHNQERMAGRKVSDAKIKTSLYFA